MATSTIAIVALRSKISGTMLKSAYGHIYESGIRSKIGAPVIFVSVAARSTGNMGCIKCQQQLVGRKRMPHSEEHRKAVCGKTACTV